MRTFAKLEKRRSTTERDFAAAHRTTHNETTLPLIVHVVGSSSQADYLLRNVAMDDSIGGS